jgi:hypothetical protein
MVPVVRQKSANEYESAGDIQTRKSAQTMAYDPKTKRLKPRRGTCSTLNSWN